MKLLIVGDVHWSQYSSIIRSRTDRFSTRLENLIESVNWAERMAESNNCEGVIYLGDFFDRAEVNAEEITALKWIRWANMPHHVLCGNHEMGDKFRYTSSARLLGLIDNFYVMDEVCSLATTYNYTLLFLPYIVESERKPLKDYIGSTAPDHKVYVFSHNDLQIQYGQYKSVNGFTLDEIEENCDRFFNGHLHNRQIIGKVENVGNLTGQNFSENAIDCPHGIVIFDTDTQEERFIENGYAFNFYKIEKKIPLKFNAIVSATCYEKDYDDMKRYLDDNAKAYKIQVKRDVKETEETPKEDLPKVDYLAKFQEYVKSTIGNDELVQSEIGEVIV